MAHSQCEWAASGMLVGSRCWQTEHSRTEPVCLLIRRPALTTQGLAISNSLCFCLSSADLRADSRPTMTARPNTIMKSSDLFGYSDESLAMESSAAWLSASARRPTRVQIINYISVRMAVGTRVLGQVRVIRGQPVMAVHERG